MPSKLTPIHSGRHMIDARLLNPTPGSGPKRGRELIGFRFEQEDRAALLDALGRGERGSVDLPQAPPFHHPQTLLQIFNRQRTSSLDEGLLHIDPLTLLDLEVFQTFGEKPLFDLLNFTRTTYGEVRLAELFAEPMRDVEKIKQRQQAVHELCEGPKMLAALQVALNRIEEPWGGPSQLTEEMLARKRRLFFWGGSELSAFFAHALPFFVVVSPMAYALLTATSELLGMGEKLTLDMVRVELISIFLVPIYFVSRQIRMLRLGRELSAMGTFASVLGQCAHILRQAGSEELREKSETIFHYLKNNHSRGTPHFLQGIRSLAEHGGFWYHKIPLDHEFYRWRCRPEIEDLLWLLGDIDALCSQAEALKKYDLSFPTFLAEGDSPSFQADEVWHPFVREPVGNPVRLDNSRRFEVISGPNMSGKSHHLKAAAVTVLMAHMGGGVPGKNVSLSPFSRLMTNVHVVDSLSQGRSLFRNEEERNAVMLQWAREGGPFFITSDEIFRGTNPEQGSASALATLEALIKAPATVGLFATHYPDVTSWVERHEEFPWVNLQFLVEQVDGHLHFPHRLAAGPSHSYLAFQVLAESGYPEDIVRRAIEIAEELAAGRQMSIR